MAVSLCTRGASTAASGLAPEQHALGGYIVQALIANIIGGASLVTALNHAQVVS